MDGNNRWSNKNNSSLFEAYKLGANNLFKLSNYLFNKKKINTVSAFTFSVNNQKRSNKIISIINRLLKYYIDDILNNKNFNFRIKFFGDLSYFSKKLQNQISSLEKININSSKTLNIFLNYGGQEEIIDMVNYFRESNKIVSKKEVDNFFNKKYNPPELLIRTGGFKRVSNFILYQLSFTELVFINKLWPDFVISDLNRIISQYESIERKFGG
jgi:undecaprenyl diphosphate synthase